MTGAVRLRRAERNATAEWTLYEWDAPDGTTWAVRPEVHPDTGAATRRFGWAVMQEDRWGGFVIVGTVGRLRDARLALASDDWRSRHGLNDPARRPMGEA